MDLLNRASIALRLPEDVGQALAEVQKTIRWRAGADGMRWTPVSEMHVSIVSLGEVSMSAFMRVREAVAPEFAKFGPIKLRVVGVGGSPTNLQPRFLWAGLEGELEKLKFVHERIEWVVKPLCPDHETRPFEPHIALGRLKTQEERERTALGRAIKIAAIGDIAEFTATHAELIRATVSTAGPTLVTEQSYKLGP